MKKILVIFTGGTIGSKLKNGVLSPDSATGYEIIDRYLQMHTTLSTKTNTAAKQSTAAEFTAVQAYDILSENLTPKHWEALLHTFKENVFGNSENHKNTTDFCGVIVTHGSDTLPYTSAAFGYLLEGVNIPVVFVCANKPIDAPQSDALTNFSAAADFILTEGVPGVFAAISSKTEANTNTQNSKPNGGTKTIAAIHLATRLLPADSFDDSFSSYGGGCFGKMCNGTFVPQVCPHNPTIADLFLKADQNRAAAIANKNFEFKNRLAIISPYPGMDYADFDFAHDKPSSVLHLLYHSSTACTIGESSILNFAKKCAEQNIDLYLLDCRHIKQGNLYQTSSAIAQTGVVLLCGMHPVAAYAKLVVAYNTNSVAPQEFMARNVFYESVI
ncbi:MAG: asparaginase [Oscillospiraceae bacterium]|jgi:L-asparaginase|nr:asparaginase [Oscillospiraceae bacterium]